MKILLLALLLVSQLSFGMVKTIRLPEAVSKRAYSLNLTRYFQLKSGPTYFEEVMVSHWLTITKEGLLEGTPGTVDVGYATAVVDTYNDAGEQERIQFQIKVTDPNDPPVWKSTPLDLGSICKGVTVSTSIEAEAYDPEGGRLFFELVPNQKSEMTSVLKVLSDGRFVVSVNSTGRFSWKVNAVDGWGAKTENTLTVESLNCDQP